MTLPQTFSWKDVALLIFDPRRPFLIPIRAVGFATGRNWTRWQKYLFSRSDPKRVVSIMNFTWMTILGHVLIAAVSLYTGQWIFLLLITFGGGVSTILEFLLGAPQHAGLMDDVPDFRLCCRTYTTNGLFRFLYWNMNYHIEHHMYPVVPCYNLKKLHKTIKHELPHTPKGLWATWVQIAYINHRQRRDAKYQYRAPLPTDATPIDPVLA